MTKEVQHTTLRTIAESPPKKAPDSKDIERGFWLLFVDRHLGGEPLLFTVGTL